MKKILKGIILIYLAGILVNGFGTEAYAGTGIYVGKEVSGDGTTIIGASSDSAANSFNRVYSVEKSAYKKGDALKDDFTGYSYEYDFDSYKYNISETAVFDVESPACNSATNEYGLGISPFVRVDASEKIILADPLVENGINERMLAHVLASSCKTARSAVGLLAEQIDTCGSAVSGIIMISDQQEAWYMEIYSGHQYAAVIMPEDKMTVFGEEFSIDTISEDDTAITSSELFNLPKEGGFEAVNTDGTMNPAKTYGKKTNDNAHAKSWVGRKIFAKDAFEIYKTKDVYPQFFEVVKKADVTDCFDLFRDRYDNEEFTKKYEGEQIETIDEDGVFAANLVQIYSDVPAEMAGIMWVNLSDPGYSAFVPVSALNNVLPQSYSDEIVDGMFSDKCASNIYFKLAALCKQNRMNYGQGVAAYWRGMETAYAYETSMLMHKEWKDAYNAAPESASELPEKYLNEVTEAAIADTTKIMDELEWFIATQKTDTSVVVDGRMQESKEPVDAVFECYFDIVAYADRMGWEVIESENELRATKGDCTLVLEYGEDRGILSGINPQVFDFMDYEEEVFENELTEAATDNVTVKEEKVSKDEGENQSKTIHDVTEKEFDHYFKDKYKKMDESGWSKEAAIEWLDYISEDISELIEHIFEQEYSDFSEDKKKSDKETAEIIVKLADDLKALTEGYLGESLEEVQNELNREDITPEETEELVRGVEADLRNLFAAYLKHSLGDAINPNLSDEEVADLLNEFQSEALRVITKYSGVDVNNISVDITEEDIIRVFEQMDDEAKKELGELFGVDVDEAIKAYQDEKTESDTSKESEAQDTTEVEDEDSSKDVEAQNDAEIQTDTEIQNETDENDENADEQDMSESTENINIMDNNGDSEIAVSMRIVEEEGRVFAPSWAMFFFAE